MRTHGIVRVFVFASAAMLVASLSVSTPISAAKGPAPLAEVQASADLVVFQPVIGYSQVRVTVSGPRGFEVVKSFDAGDPPAVELPGADGLYKYELRFSPELSDGARERLAAAREDGIDLGSNKAADKRTVQRGWFTLTDGAVVPALVEPEPKVLLTNADGVIRNSLCVGFDCPNSPLFDDSTILMMENNTRIKFGDTSNSPFPNNDWEIEANSSLSGGASYLGFNDCGNADNDGGCATDLVFAVEAGARSSALHVESDGDIGIGTSNPVLDIHVVTGNTPALRLDQDGSSGFTPQVWDVAGNETNFFVRDATNGSTLPFRIRPGAPSNSIFVDVDGDVGFRTSSPDAATNARVHIASVPAGGTGLRIEGALSGAALQFVSSVAGAEAWFQTVFGTGFVISRPGSGGSEFEILDTGGFRFRNGATNLMEILSNGDVNSATGTFGTISDRTKKENFLPVDGRSVLERVVALPISEWNYKSQADSIRHMGPMAQDFYAAFGLYDSAEKVALSDLSGVALAAIQGLNDVVEQKDEELRARLARLEALISTLGD